MVVNFEIRRVISPPLYPLLREEGMLNVPPPFKGGVGGGCEFRDPSRNFTLPLYPLLGEEGKQFSTADRASIPQKNSQIHIAHRFRVAIDLHQANPVRRSVSCRRLIKSENGSWQRFPGAMN